MQVNLSENNDKLFYVLVFVLFIALVFLKVISKDTWLDENFTMASVKGYVLQDFYINAPPLDFSEIYSANLINRGNSLLYIYLTQTCNTIL